MYKVVCPVCKSDKVQRKISPIWCTTYNKINYACLVCNAVFIPYTKKSVEYSKIHYYKNSGLERWCI